MVRNRKAAPPPVATVWAAPMGLPIGDAGRPICCIATTYTFHARLLEADLLPRFLGLKRDVTERERAFIVEREEALSLVRAAVLVDARHVDRGQTSLRWDQIPVVVPGGAQHSKVALLARENAVRLVVTSANLTTTGYRLNREMAAVLDFFDHPESVPRHVLRDALDLLDESLRWTANGPARRRVGEVLADVRGRVGRWKDMPDATPPNRLPKVSFAAGWPRRIGRAARSPVEAFLAAWGEARRADELIVMTPTVGQDGESREVIRRLLALPRQRGVVPNLVVPGSCDPEDASRVVVALPASFRAAWADELGVKPEDVPTFVPPRRRDGEKRDRELHAKALLASDSERGLIMLGSSNFSPHGMGVGAANLEANLCVVESMLQGSEGPGHAWCLPLDLDTDLVEQPVWPEAPVPIEEEAGEGVDWVPLFFAWAVFDQRNAILRVGLDESQPAPAAWSIHLAGEGRSDLTIVDSASAPPAEDGQLRLPLGEAMRGVLLIAIRIAWRANGEEHNAHLLVQAESPDLLVPPGAHLALSASQIVTSLIAGRNLADAEPEEDGGSEAKRPTAELDALRTVETSGYLLYRTRQLGRALAALGERIQGTLHTVDAMRYRLMNDPLGPGQLADALVREAAPGEARSTEPSSRRTDLAFSLAEIALVLGHAGKRVSVARCAGEPDLRPLFREAARSVLGAAACAMGAEKPRNLDRYVADVAEKCGALLGGLEVKDAR